MSAFASTANSKQRMNIHKIKKDAELVISISGFPRNIGGKILEVSNTNFTILVYKKRIVRCRNDNRDFYYCPAETLGPMDFEMKHVDKVRRMDIEARYNEDYDFDFDDLDIDMFDDALNFMLPGGDDDDDDDEDFTDNEE
jgi:hypothetical protein